MPAGPFIVKRLGFSQGEVLLEKVESTVVEPGFRWSLRKFLRRASSRAALQTSFASRQDFGVSTYAWGTACALPATGGAGGDSQCLEQEPAAKEKT
eukprot:symbB.v1.2.020223.t1/scaffold1651.1/size107612/8